MGSVIPRMLDVLPASGTPTRLDLGFLDEEWNCSKAGIAKAFAWFGRTWAEVEPARNVLVSKPDTCTDEESRNYAIVAGLRRQLVILMDGRPHEMLRSYSCCWCEVLCQIVLFQFHRPVIGSMMFSGVLRHRRIRQVHLGYHNPKALQLQSMLSRPSVRPVLRHVWRSAAKQRTIQRAQLSDDSGIKWHYVDGRDPSSWPQHGPAYHFASTSQERLALVQIDWYMTEHI